MTETIKQITPYELARMTVETYILSQKVLETSYNLKDVPEKKAGTFVSIKTHQGDLRGCIGTILPVYPTICEEIIYNAISAATKDFRFVPVSREELPHLKYSVDILSAPEKIQDPALLDPATYGVIVSTKDGRRGLLLPDLHGVDTVEKQLSISKQKANIHPSEPVELMRFKVTRHSEPLTTFLG